MHDAHHVEQPMPVPNDRPIIQELVIADVRQRLALGIERYGTGLQVGNGRDMLQDAYEESLDLATYLRGLIAEREERSANADVDGVAVAGHVLRDRTAPG